MRTRESLLTLVQELVGDAKEIQRLLIRNRTAWERIQAGADDPVDWGALGFTIQTLYSVLENYFLRVSKLFENNLPPDRWHSALVEKMGLDIPEVRPAVLSTDEQVREVRIILRFRHRLRNLYGEDLDPHKTREVQSVVSTFFDRFPVIHDDFVSKIRSIASVL